MKLLSVISLLFIVLSCTDAQKTKNLESNKSSKTFNEQLVDIVTEYADGKVTQIFIPFDDNIKFSENDIKNTKPVLAEILKKKGFYIIETKFGDFNTGCTDLKIKLRKDSCDCLVYRVYEGTKLIDSYRIRESINCWKKKQ